MFTTPTKPHRAAEPGTPASGEGPASVKMKLCGYFHNGQWFCNCSPRLPALRLQVKKETRNKGKWFYTCQREREDQCGFFLFADAAQAREQGALLRTPKRERSQSPTRGPQPPQPPSVRRRLFQDTPGRGEDAPGVGTSTEPWAALSTVRVLARAPPPGVGLAAEPASAGCPAREMRLELPGGDGGASDPGGHLSSDGARQAARLADEGARTAGPQPPRRGAPSTPKAQQRTRDTAADLPTPSSGGAEGRAAAAEAKRQWSGRAPDGYCGSLADEVMALLRDTPMTEPVRRAVRDALDRHALRARGVERGRDMARAAARAKDGRIAELQARVAALEDEHRVKRERAVALHSGLMSLYVEGGE